MAVQLPESNADQVALNLVHNAIIDEFNAPGEALTKLFEQMAEMSREIGGDFRLANSDWQALLDGFNESEIEPVVRCQTQVMGDTWAKRWLLCMMAKRLYEDLEHSCLDHPAASKIERVTYDRCGKLESWTLRRDS